MVHPTEHLITCELGGTCKACGCRIAKGASAMFTPAPKVGLTRPGFSRFGKVRKIASSIRHLDGECGSEYMVKAIYRATAKTIKVPAMDAAEALATGIKQFLKGNPIARPELVEVWQGGFRITSKMIPAIADTETRLWCVECQDRTTHHNDRCTRCASSGRQHTEHSERTL